MGDDATDEPPTIGRLDQLPMQTVGRRAQSHRLIESWEFVPDGLSLRSLPRERVLCWSRLSIRQQLFDAFERVDNVTQSHQRIPPVSRHRVLASLGA